jgi:hypothetical protein
MSTETKYRIDIQALRGLSVLAVVLFHTNESLFPLGYLGVDVFFVISGFVVTPLILRIFTEQALAGRLSNLKYFYLRRFYRLAPAFGVVVSVSVILIFFLGPALDHQKFTEQGIATLLLLGNLGAYKFSGDYFSPNPNPLVHTWSLSVEEQIYLLLPLLLLLVINNGRRPKSLTGMVLIVFAPISFISFLFPTILQPLYFRAGIATASQFSFYSPVDRFWQFALGGLSFLLIDRYQNVLKKIPRKYNLVLAILLVILLFGPDHLNPKVTTTLATLVTTGALLLRSLDALPCRIRSKLKWLGDRSYSIYLVHMPLLYLAKTSPILNFSVIQNRIIQIVIAFVSSILFGSICYSIVENRFRNRSENEPNKSNFNIFVISLLLPSILLLTMNIGSKNNYWGLEKSIPQPIYAGFLDPNCERDSSNGPPCVYLNKGATKSVLLVGDSHAGHISQAVVDAAKNQRWNSIIWTHSGCRLQLRQGPDQKVPNYCIDNNNLLVSWALRNKPDLIIVSQFVQSDSNLPELKEALSTLSAIVPRVLLIGNSPVFPDDEDFMRRRAVLLLPYNPPKAFLLSEMQTKDNIASNHLATWAISSGLSTMEFSPLFCGLRSCSRFLNGLWLYRDVDHFSVAGAALTIPMLENFLKDSREPSARPLQN